LTNAFSGSSAKTAADDIVRTMTKTSIIETFFIFFSPRGSNKLLFFAEHFGVVTKMPPASQQFTGNLQWHIPEISVFLSSSRCPPSKALYMF
jgi:hypothetical protein